MTVYRRPPRLGPGSVAILNWDDMSGPDVGGSYASHNGQKVTILRDLYSTGEAQYEVKSADGWTGIAYDSQLLDVSTKDAP